MESKKPPKAGCFSPHSSSRKRYNQASDSRCPIVCGQHTRAWKHGFGRWLRSPIVLRRAHAFSSRLGKAAHGFFTRKKTRSLARSAAARRTLPALRQAIVLRGGSAPAMLAVARVEETGA